MKEKLKDLQEFVDKLNYTNSNNDKLTVITEYKDNEFIKKVLLYTYSPYLKFNITPDTCVKRSDLVFSENKYTNDLFQLLDDLNNRIISGHTAIKFVNSFISEYTEFKSLIFCILDKNLKVRVDSKSINKIIPNCIPQFEVALANKWDDKISKKISFNDGWYVSRKLDGIRFVTVIDNDYNVVSYTRTGHVLNTVGVVHEELKKLKINNVVFDGELCIVNENGDEDFNAIQKLWNKKDYTIPNPKYKLFDLINMYDFQNLYSSEIFSERYEKLKYILSTYSGKVLDLVEQVKVDNDGVLLSWVDKAIDKGWEGVMLRKDTVYQGKRSNDLLKVKQFIDDEYIVEDIEIGPFRVIVNGKEVEEIVLTNVFIKHKGHRVSIGSGFSLEERRYYKENPSEIIGKEITVTYFSESINQKGQISLRIPTLKTIYPNGRNN